MFSTSTYGERYRHDLAAENGLTVRLSFDQLSYTGSVVEISHGPRQGSCVISGRTGSGGDAASPLSPVAATQATVRLMPTPTDRREGTADLAALGALPTGSVRLRILMDLTTEGSPTDLVWMGYLPTGWVSDTPGEDLVPVDLTFVDGFGLLNARAAVDPTVPGHTTLVRALLDWLRQWLAPLAADEVAALKIVTRTDWRPWLDGVEVASTTDPLAAVRALAQAFSDPPEGGSAAEATAQDVAARQTLARMLARCTFGRDHSGRVGWHVTQRGTLSRIFAEDPAGSVATWTYPLTAADVDTVAGTRTTETPTVDTLPWDMDGGPGGAVIRYATRGRGGGVRVAQSDYDFRPDIENLIFNGSFETAGATASTARYWTLTETTRTGLTDYDASYTDRFQLALPGRTTLETRAAANQADLAFFVAGENTQLDVSFNGFGGLDPNYNQDDGRWKITVGPFGLVSGTVTVAQDALKGRDGILYIQPLLSGVTGFVDGTPVLPPGTVLTFGSVEATLREAAKAGDIALRADLAEAVSAAATASICYFAPSGTAAAWNDFGLPDGDSAAFSVACRCYARAIDGTLVSGYVEVDLEGPVDDLTGYDPMTDPPPDTSGLGVDDFVLRPLTGGNTLGSYGSRAMLPAGSGASHAAALPVADTGGHSLGDGPLPTSATRLQVSPDSGTTEYDTQQGANTGWKAGTYASEEASTARTIDALAAAESVAQLAGRDGEQAGPEAWDGTLILPQTGSRVLRTFDPTAVYLLCQPCRLSEPAYSGAPEVVLSAPPKPGHKIVLATDDADDGETHYVGVVSGGHPWTATLVDSAGDPATVDTVRSRHARCLYQMPGLWESYAWDLGMGRVQLSARDLAWRDPGATAAASTLIEQLTLGS